MIRLSSVEFLKSATEARDYPTSNVPEVAFAGRSNVGKSSMINALTGRKKLVRVSHTPGRTKTLNFIDVRLENGAKKHHLHLCDLPGYGYAKVSKEERASWKSMLQQYFTKRTSLKAVVLIIDSEVGPTELDSTLLELLENSEAHILVAATKIDRLAKAKRKPALARAAETLNVPNEAVVEFSAHDGLGIEEVWRRLCSVT